ncbi:hypothetical protein RA27_05305 [Ruegeria sp. ANG-R]|nr:hypothetical protein RA27_05305 [Ruegeria sp. ANG-R]
MKIKYELQKAGSSFIRVARDLGISHSTVLAVSNSRGVSARVQDSIAEKLGVSPSELWPERYQEENKNP